MPASALLQIRYSGFFRRTFRTGLGNADAKVVGESSVVEKLFTSTSR